MLPSHTLKQLQSGKSSITKKIGTHLDTRSIISVTIRNRTACNRFSYRIPISIAFLLLAFSHLLLNPLHHFRYARTVSVSCSKSKNESSQQQQQQYDHHISPHVRDRYAPSPKRTAILLIRNKLNVCSGKRHHYFEFRKRETRPALPKRSEVKRTKPFTSPPVLQWINAIGLAP